MAIRWTADRVLTTARSFQQPCVLAAAVDLDVFTVLATRPMDAAGLAVHLRTDTRATTVLLDTLASMGLLNKRGGTYRVPAAVAELLTENGARSVLPMVRHQANCMRRWVQLPWVVQSGQPAERKPSIRGPGADQASFIGAMHTISEPVAREVIASLGPMSFRHLLDVGGGSGTWTIALLEAAPEAKATLFDLPDVIPMARERLTGAGLAERVALVPGDFYTDPLPPGADLVWLSAIAHQNSREQNRTLFEKIHGALAPGGTLLIRDVVMSDDHVRPPAGTLFAINMLVATEAGGTYSLAEYAEDLQAAGFTSVEQVRRDPWMDSVVRAVRA